MYKSAVIAESPKIASGSDIVDTMLGDLNYVIGIEAGKIKVLDVSPEFKDAWEVLDKDVCALIVEESLSDPVGLNDTYTMKCDVTRCSGVVTLEPEGEEEEKLFGTAQVPVDEPTSDRPPMQGNEIETGDPDWIHSETECCFTDCYQHDKGIYHRGKLGWHTPPQAPAAPRRDALSEAMGRQQVDIEMHDEPVILKTTEEVLQEIEAREPKDKPVIIAQDEWMDGCGY